MGNLAFTKDKNQIGTPWHIVEFLSDLLETQNKRVLDPTAGSGNMLEFAGVKIGIEYDAKAFEMLQERYQEGHFIHASVFDSTEWMKQQNPDVVLMNPPFNMEKTKGLEFVRFVADTINHGRLAALVPTNCGATGKKVIDKVKEELLSNHTLEAVFSFNKELFYPAASASAICMIFKLGEPHQGKTWFADFQDDGLEKSRHEGRIDSNGLWEGKKTEWLTMFQEKPSWQISNSENRIPCELKEITAKDNWTPSDAISRDPESLRPTLDDFRQTVREYMDYRIGQIGLNQFLKENPHLLPPKEERIKNLQKQIALLQKEIEELQKEN